MDISRLLPNSEYQAAINSNLPSAINPFATIADVPQGLSPTLAISNVMLDSDQIESVDGKTILQVNNLGVAAIKGTIGVDVVSSLDISDGQAQFFLFSPTFSRSGGFGLFANDVLRNFNAGAGDSYPTRISAKGGILNANIKNSVQIGGNSTIVKTDETAYCNQLAFNTGEAFETIVDYVTPTADRTATLQDRDGTLSFVDQIGGQDVNALVTSPTITEDGYVLTWNQTNGEYELVAGGGGGSNIYNADGTVGTFRSVELTDILTFTNTSAEPIFSLGHFGGNGFMQIGSNIHTLAVQIDAYVGTSDTSFNSGTGNGLKIQANTGSIQTYNQNLGSPTGTFNMQGNNVVWTMPANKTGTVALTSDITGTNSGTNTGDQNSGTTFFVSNDAAVRTIDANNITGAVLRDVLCTLIRDLNTAGVLTV